jgi:hypothetical protein
MWRHNAIYGYMHCYKVCNRFQFTWKEFENSTQIGYSKPYLLWFNTYLHGLRSKEPTQPSTRGVTTRNRHLIITQEFSVQWSRKLWELKSNCKVYAYTVKHNYVLCGMQFTICKAQLYVSAINIDHLHVVQWKLIDQIYMRL